jgi:hypothetical protein
MKKIIALASILAIILFSQSLAQSPPPRFKVLAFFTAHNDLAHISFVHEANKWFYEMGLKNNFSYDSTNDWTLLNKENLAKYQVVLFLDTRPEAPEQRQAFQEYMEKGGGWMGFHFAGFALTPSDFPQNWDWYHNQFLGVGQYKGNTWRPVPAMLRVGQETSFSKEKSSGGFQIGPQRVVQLGKGFKSTTRY